MSAEHLLGLIIGVLIGLAIGSGVAWVVCSSQAAARTDTAVALEGQRAAAAEALVEDTRNQLQAAKAEMEAGREAVRKIREAWAGAKTRLEQTEKNLKDQRDMVETAKFKLVETFEALAAKALNQNNRGFLALAEEKFSAIRSLAGADLDARKNAIEALVTPIRENLAALDKQTRELETKRSTAIGSVQEQLRAVAATQSTLQRETANLVNALKSPQGGGRWGEITLRRIAELAGMVPRCDFVEQQTLTIDGTRFRPDMIVKLPAGRDVVVDSKVSFEDFLKGTDNSATEEARNAALDRHAKNVAQHVGRLAAKEYWAQFQSGPEFVVLFIPNDSFLAAAAERDASLIESALAKKVIIATPTTLFALLRAIYVGWQQHNAVENAERIRHLGQDLYDRFATLVEHLSRVRSGLDKAVEGWDAAVRSLEHMLLPAARRFKELGAGGRKVIEELLPLDKPVRQVFVSDGADGEESAAKNPAPRLFD
jgi:DNA recombination protein RmuC